MCDPPHVDAEDAFEAAPVAYLVVDRAFCIRRVNRTMVRLVDDKPGDLVGRRLIDLVAPHDRDRADKVWQVGSASPREHFRVEEDLDLVHASGEFVTVRAFHGPAQPLGHRLVTLIDVSELHDARRQVEDRWDLHRQLEVTRDLHDSVRQRLFGVTTMIEVLGGSMTLSEPQALSLARVERELAGIISDIRVVIFGEDDVAGSPTRRTSG